MHRVLVRIKIVKTSALIEAGFDERLSLNDNLKLFSKLYDIDPQRCELYDPHKKIFPERNIPLKQMGSGNIFLHLFN